MSEQPRTNSRLQNFEDNKRAHQQAEFEDSLYGEAGSSDFSDVAKRRVEEADAYERHLESIQGRDSADSSDDYQNPYMDNLHTEALATNAAFDQDQLAAATAEQARIDEIMNSDVRIRQMALIARDIASISATLVTEDNEARMSAQLNDKQDRLQELLVNFSEQNELSPADAETVMGRVIDMTEASSEATATVEAATPDQAAERNLLPDYTPEELASRLAAVKRVKAETAESDRVAETEQAALGEEVSVESSDEVSEPISAEGLEPVSPEETTEDEATEPSTQRIDTPAEDGESLEEYEARNGVEASEPISLEGLEPVSPEADEQTVEQSKRKRIAARMNPAVLFHRAQAWNYQRSQRERTPEDSERSNNKKAIIGLGVLAVATGTAIYLGSKYGIDLSRPGGGGGSTGGGNELLASNTGGNSLNWNDFDSSARKVTPGEGWNSTFDQMGIAKKDWGDVLNTAGPKLGKLGEAYYDNSSKEWRISRPGKLSNDALRVIASASRKNGVDLQ